MLRTLPLRTRCHGGATSIRSFTASWVPHPSSSTSNADAAGGGGSWASPAAGDGSCSSLVGPGEDSKARIGTRSGDGTMRRAAEGAEEGKEAKRRCWEGENTRRVAAQRLEEWHYDAALEHEKPRIARHERPPPWPLPLPLVPPHPLTPTPDQFGRVARDGSGCEEEQPASGWIWARWRSR